MSDVVIVSACRSPLGKFGGALKDVSAVELGQSVVKEALARAQIDGQLVDEVIFGNVLAAGLGQNPARQIALKAGLPQKVAATTINMVCGSGLKAVCLGASMIKAGDAQVVVCGGSENMSAAPYLLPSMRFGARLNDSQVIDSLIHDGLQDAFSGEHMGLTAERVAAQFKISRQVQDEFALTSQLKAQKAQTTGRFEAEIVPLTQLASDETIRYDTSLEKLAKLKPVFKANGTVTAGNAAGLNDGAAALVLMAKETAQARGLDYLAEIKAYANVGLDPQVMGLGPIEAVKKLVAQSDLQLADFDLIEANEAFAAQALAVLDQLKLDTSKVNVNGGSLALGHPLGASGARILVTLLYELKRRQANLGLATLCVGGGQGVALAVQAK
ncbi:acetyl-CoA C-acetyltransferase [Lactobacillus agilis]|uniref:acetyl-CoA C-acetyltransferase n=1 Tax=Ligilactobacillus agilis TaxID=1601 RepID=A0A848C1H6_9LACO|nr:acetyl-CoA C-acetyltransferase [Ligilactobacillus agilis]NME41233.1 acetyl-CoA C-acetyltransferase [Ligilactobacillus agilis]